MNTTFKKYFNNCNGVYIAFEKNRKKLLILNKFQDVVKEVFVSESVKDINLNFESLFDSYKNNHDLNTELSVMENGHDKKDWLFLPHHVFGA